MQTTDGYMRRRKWLAGISVGVVLILATLATIFVCRWLVSFDQDSFRDYIHSFGALGWLVLLGLQFLQVFIALIPGELLESAAGYAYGPVMGTLICYIGVAAASCVIFLLTRRFGTRLVEVFISREKLQQLRFLKTEQRRNFLVFLLFFIPGTPKDLLTYFIGLTDMKLSHFLMISLVARIPSVLSSTFGGHLLGAAQYWGALLLYGITGAVSLLGFWYYHRFIGSKQSK